MAMRIDCHTTFIVIVSGSNLGNSQALLFLR